MAEWIIVSLTALGTLGAIVTVMIKVSSALSRNTDAIKRLTEVMDKQDEMIAKLDNTIDNHEGRIVAIETIHKIRGCDGVAE